MNDARPNEERRSLPLGIELVATLLAGTVLVWTFYPGLMSTDSLVQYQQAATGEYSDWHPPLMAWVWRQLLRFTEGPVGMLVLHVLAFMAGLFLWARALFQAAWARVAFIAAIAFFPPVFALVGTIWKDVGLMVSLALATGVFAYLQRSAPCRWTKWLLALALVALFYALAVRLNGAPGVLPLLVWFGYLVARMRGESYRRGLVYGAGTGLLLVFAAVGVNRGLSSRSQHPEQQVMLHDLSAISLAKGELVLPSYASKNVDLEGLRAHYYPESVVPLFFPEYLPLTEDPAELSELRETWRSAILDEPDEYLEHRWVAYERMLNLSAPVVCYPFHAQIDPNGLGIKWSPTRAFQATRGVLERLRNSVLFRSWIYVALCLIVGLGVLFVRRLRMQAPEAIYLGASGSLYALGYFIYAPACDFRYVLWTVVACLFMLFAALRGVARGYGPSRS